MKRLILSTRLRPRLAAAITYLMACSGGLLLYGTGPGQGLGTQCTDMNTVRDGRGYPDSCKGTPPTLCNPMNEPSCAVYLIPPDLWFACWPCASQECECSGQPVSVTTVLGFANKYDNQGCNWGPRNGGECFCLYNRSNPVGATLYECM